MQNAPGTPNASQPPAATADASLPGGIEIFRAGRHTDSSGRAHDFPPELLRQIVETYNPTLREAPLTVGHPADNLPAYGWVKALYVNEAGNLAIDPHQVDPAFADMVSKGRFKKRSASFYPPGAPHNPTPGKWYLRHVAFLGAQPPAVAGLKDIGFAAGDAEGTLSFADDEPVSSHLSPGAQNAQPASKEKPMADKDPAAANGAELEQLRAQLAAATQAKVAAEAEAQKAKDAAASFAEKAAADRRAGFVAFCEEQVKAGRLLPKDKGSAVAALEAASGAGEVEFAEGSTTTKVNPLAWLQGVLATAKPAVSFGEMAGGAVGGFDARGKTDEEVHAAALAYQAKHPTVSYAEAANAVVSFGG